MKTNRLLAATALATTVCLIAVSPASAQDTAPADDAAADTIIVTGSRIRSPNLESIAPITTVTASELTNSGSVSIGDALNDLPSLRSTFTSANSTRAIGTTGLSLLDLRGLGVARTLVLQNSKRLVSATEGDNSPDVSTIPSALIDRVDIVTGGTSAVYGSDAIAGVVNFVLKDNYDGISVRGQSGISSKGDRPTQALSLTAGTNFAEGRGNIAASVEYSHNGQLKIPDRSFTRVRFQLQQVQFDPAGTNSDGVPDRQFFGDVRSLILSQGGTFVPTISNANPATFIARTNPDGTVVRVARVYRFNSDGSIAQANYGTRDFRFGTLTDGVFNNGGGNNTLGGDGETLRDYGQLQPEIKRYVANALGHFDISPAFVPYFEAKYVRVDSLQESSPTFGQGGAARGPVAGATFASNSAGIPIRFDNPYLTAASSAFLRTITTAGDGFFRINRNNLDLGSRGEDGKRQTYRGVVGVKGDFNDDWNYDVSLNYGRVNNRVISLNNRVQQRFELAVDATRDPGGNIVCRSRLVAPAPLPVADANGRPIPVNIAKNAQLANDIAQCVPINVLGNGSPSAAATNYVNANTVFTGRSTQLDLLGFVSGDLSQLFELPGGPVAFSIGGEYRRETARSSYGSIVSSGLTFLNAIPDFNPGTLTVKEAFGEISIPVVKDKFLFNELTFNGAGRYSKYNNKTGGVFAYNAGAIYSPVAGLRFRGNYSVAVRAPTLSDLFSSPTQNFANPSDPCDVQNINSGSPTRVANCAALGIPAGFINLPARSQSTELLDSGNDQLFEERSKSYTVGGVFTPKFLPGFSFSADFYRIVVKNVIQSVSAQNTLNLCVDAPTLNNSFCPNVLRDPVTFFFQRPGILTKSFNFAKRIASGIDVDTSYRANLGTDKTLTTRLNLTWVKDRDNFPIINDAGFRDQIKNELGDPEFAFNIDVDLKVKNFTLSYGFRFLDKQYVNTIEDIISINGGLPQNPDYSDPLFYKSVTYSDFRLSYEVDKRFEFFGGVDNAFDKIPPLGLTGTGAGSGIYDNVGRFFYVGATAKF